MVIFLRQLTWLDLLSRLLPVLCIYTCIHTYACIYTYITHIRMCYTVSSAVGVAGSAVEAASGTLHLRTYIYACCVRKYILRQLIWLDLLPRLLPVLCVYMCIYTRCVWMYLYVYIHTRIHIHVSIYIYTYVYMCVHIYIYI